MCKWKELPNIHAFFYLSFKHCLCSSSFPSHVLPGVKPEPKYSPILLILLMSPTILSSAFKCSFCPINLFFPSSKFLFQLLNPHTYFDHPPLITCFFATTGPWPKQSNLTTVLPLWEVARVDGMVKVHSPISEATLARDYFTTCILECLHKDALKPLNCDKPQDIV